MARRFTAASADRFNVATADLGGFNWQFGTQAVMMYRPVDTGAVEALVGTQAGAIGTQQLVISSGDLLAVDDDVNLRTLTGAIAVNQHILVGFTKATGTVVGRGHKYVFTTNTWTHAAMSGTTVNSSATTSLQIGAYDDTGFEPASAEIWAIGMWNKIAMTDSEFERLARGNWLSYAPDFYEQWSDGREVGDMGRTMGLLRPRQTTRTGTSRGAQKPPPGFRMCVQRRRR